MPVGNHNIYTKANEIQSFKFAIYVKLLSVAFNREMLFAYVVIHMCMIVSIDYQQHQDPWPLWPERDVCHYQHGGWAWPWPIELVRWRSVTGSVHTEG